MKPTPGQLYERDGKQRLVKAVRENYNGTYTVEWVAVGSQLKRTEYSFSLVWEVWVQMARVVEEVA